MQVRFETDIRLDDVLIRQSAADATTTAPDSTGQIAAMWPTAGT
jgi:hypothetical protein